MKTDSGAGDDALKEALRIRKVEGLAEFFGKKLWRGNLSEMREDRIVRRVRKRRSR